MRRAIEIIFDPTKSAIGGCSSSSSRSTTRRPQLSIGGFYTSDEQKRIAKAAIAANSFAGFNGARRRTGVEAALE